MSLDWILVAMATNSLARYFLVKTQILESLGVVEVPVKCVMKEAVQFTFPAVMRIMERLQDTGGGFISFLDVPISPMLLTSSLCSDQARSLYSRLHTHPNQPHGTCGPTAWQVVHGVTSNLISYGFQP